MKKLKQYRVDVYFQGEKTIYVKAKNSRDAWGKASRRVKKQKIGNNLRSDFSDVDLVEEEEPDYILKRDDSYLILGKDICQKLMNGDFEELLQYVYDGCDFAMFHWIEGESRLGELLGKVIEYGDYAFVSKGEYERICKALYNESAGDDLTTIEGAIHQG